MSTAEEEKKPSAEVAASPTAATPATASTTEPSAEPAVQVINVNSEIKLIVPIVEPPPVSSQVPINADTVFTGDVLKQVRESRNLTLREIADRTRISVASISALETERFEDLPNARVYVRGFVRCYAVEIGLDKEAVSRTYLPRWQAWYENQHGRA